MAQGWFRPKRYGFGAAPASWQGWALTAAYLVLILALSSWLAEGAAAGNSRFVPFTAVAVLATLVYVIVAWRTTEGGWRWRWGRD